MRSLTVGKPLQEGITRYNECCKFDVTDSGLNLFIFFNQPTDEEINDIRNGQFKFGYYKENNVLLLLFKFGNQQWMDAPYSVHLSKNLTELQEIEDNMGYSLTVCFTDASNGILKVIRQIGLDTKSSRMLREDILNQKEMSFDNFDVNLNNIYKKYSTKMLVSMSKALYIKK